uniref:NAD-dependent epimerase/dehydratase domain-containing protein n=1 Tax=viral metagenome TaxID=1070528 RepID=A0A6C0CMS9_9ZZZZ
MKKTILITGGTGLVGYGLQSIQDQYDYNFIFLSSSDCDLTILETTIELFEYYKPDYVIHLAACVGGLLKNMKYRVDMYEKNMMINNNVLHCCHRVGVKKVVSCLSTCIFPDKTTYPINETMLHDGPPHDSNYPYAYAKRMLEIQSKAYQEQYGDNFICVIPTNIYGENDNYHLEDAHVIPALIHKCFLAKNTGNPFKVLGTGTPLRQFIYSKDLAKLIMWTLESYDLKDSIILSVGEKEEVTIKDVATYIAREFNYEHMIEFNDSFPDGQYKKTADNSKLMSLYPEFKFTHIQEGIQKSVSWFIENLSNCRA